MTYRLTRMREVLVEEQVQQVLTYIQRESVDIWKESILENLEIRELKFPIVEDFLTKLKKRI